MSLCHCVLIIIIRNNINNNNDSVLFGDGTGVGINIKNNNIDYCSTVQTVFYLGICNNHDSIEIVPFLSSMSYRVLVRMCVFNDVCVCSYVCVCLRV